MDLLAIISALVAMLAGIALWLLSIASLSHVMQRFPEYGTRIYRLQRTTFQEYPVRTYRLLFDELPAAADATVRLMRCLAWLAWGSTIAALAFWLVA